MKPVHFRTSALDELDAMYSVYLRGSKRKLQISRVVTVTNEHEEILKAIDPKLLKDNDARQWANLSRNSGYYDSV